MSLMSFFCGLFSPLDVRSLGLNRGPGLRPAGSLLTRSLTPLSLPQARLPRKQRFRVPHKRSPGDGGWHRGFEFLMGETCDGEGNPSQRIWLYTRSVTTVQ
jgi:hypothetical protein